MCLSFLCSLHSFQLSVFQNILKQFCFRVVAWNQSYLLPTVFPYNVSRNTDACFRIVDCACLSKPSSRGREPSSSRLHLTSLLTCHLHYKPVSRTRQCPSWLESPEQCPSHYWETSFLLLSPEESPEFGSPSKLSSFFSSTRFLIKGKCSSAFLAQ